MKITIGITSVLLLTGVFSFSQPGPNWAEILNKNRMMMKEANVREVKVIKYKYDEPSFFFHEFYDADGRLLYSLDCRFGKLGDKTRLFWSKIAFDYSDNDTLVVTGYDAAGEPEKVDQVDTLNWRDHIQNPPEEWKQSYEFYYGKDRMGYYKFDGKRFYNSDSLLDKVEKYHEGELVLRRQSEYEDEKVVSITKHKKTIKKGFKLYNKTFFTYTESGDPDSIYTIQYANMLGYDDTTLSQKTNFYYDKKERLIEEVVTENSRVKSKVKYDYSEIDEGYYYARKYNGIGRFEGFIRYLESGVEVETRFLDPLGKLKHTTLSEYVYFDD